MEIWYEDEDTCWFEDVPLSEIIIAVAKALVFYEGLKKCKENLELMINRIHEECDAVGYDLEYSDIKYYFEEFNDSVRYYLKEPKWSRELWK